MYSTSSPVIDQIARLGGAHSARLLDILATEFLRPRESRENHEPLPAASGLDAALRGADVLRERPPGGVSFNLIPGLGADGACCPLLVGVALAGFSGRSIGRRLTFPDLTFRVAAHALRCHGVHRETLILTPDWNQRAFEARLAPLFAAFQDAGRPAFVVETARTGLFLRWPW